MRPGRFKSYLFFAIEPAAIHTLRRFRRGEFHAYASVDSSQPSRENEKEPIEPWCGQRRISIHLYAGNDPSGMKYMVYI
jgi:hypothetical protein